LQVNRPKVSLHTQHTISPKLLKSNYVHMISNSYFSISLVITTFNSAQYLPALFSCIKSLILPQQYEILFIDDCSTDNTQSLIKEFIYSSKSMSLISNESNLGPGASRNVGIHAASCSYIFFLDADDIIEANTFESLSQHLIAYPDLQVILCDTKWINSQANNIRAGCTIYPSNTLFTSIDVPRLFRKRFQSLSDKGIFDCKGRLILLSFLRDNNILFDEKLRYLEDEVFLWQLYSHSNSIFYDANQFYSYLINPFNTTGVVQGLLSGFDLNLLLHISETAHICFLRLGATAQCALLFKNQVLSYFIINVLVSIAKSSMQAKISYQSANDFMYSLVTQLRDSPVSRRSLSHYQPCTGESRLILFSLRILFMPLILFAVYRRASQILSKTN